MSFLVFSLIAYFFVDPILTWLAKPVGKFVFTSPTGAFLIRLKIAASVGGVAAFPYGLYQVWKFMEAAFFENERAIAMIALPFSCALFFVGIAAALFGVAPLALKFLVQFKSPVLLPMISIESYISFLFWMIIGFGVLFQLPLVVLALCRAGVAEVSTLRTYRKHAAVTILVVAALLTPGPDIISQLVLAIPCYVLFEISLLLAGRLKR